ncbi:hypothetical protein JCM19992_11600 [Thermostilla marina]
MVASGCSQRLESGYGRCTGTGREGINGLSAFASMLQQAGHDVTVATRLTYDLYDADCIIWAPNAFAPPSDETRSFLDDWLDTSGSHLIFIGREYDAFPYYFECAASVVDDSRQQATYRSQAEAAEAIFEEIVAGLPEKATCSWYTVRRKGKRHIMRNAAGSPQLLRGVAKNNVHLELYAEWSPPKDAEILLTVGPERLPFVFRSPVARPWGDMFEDVWHAPDMTDSSAWSEHDRLENVAYRWVIANGSFLFNVPLVDHENRRLAANLINALGDEPLKIVILETNTTDVPIGEAATSESPGIFRAYPLNWILVHWTIVAVLALFMRFPIFGKPRDLATTGSTDFGQHVAALADLLRRTRDEAFAQECVDIWLARSKRQKVPDGAPPKK